MLWLNDYFNQLRLSSRVIILIFGWSFGGMFCLGSAFIVYKYDMQIESFEDSCSEAINLASNSFSQVLWNLDETTASALGDSFMNYEDNIKAIEVRDNTGAVFLTRGVRDELDGAVLKKMPIVYRGETIGYVEITFDKSPFRSALYRELMVLILLALSLCTVISYLAYRSTSSIILRPFNFLVDAIRSLRGGNFNRLASTDLPPDFLEIIEAFNDSIVAIGERDAKIHAHALRLQLEVEKKVAELESQRALSVESARLASLSEVAAGIAHEINNPLAVISSRAQILISKMSRDRSLSEYKISVEKIEAMVERISKIILGLKAFSRDGSKDFFEIISFQKIISDITGLCEGRLRQRDIKFLSFVIPDNLSICCREVQVAQVLINLINNAADAIENLSVRWIKLTAEIHGQEIVIRVVDSGSGIDKSIADRMFDPFFTSKPVGKGTGLGLSISLGIVRDHNGSLSYVESEKNTTFEIRLPVDLAAGAPDQNVENKGGAVGS